MSNIPRQSEIFGNQDDDDDWEDQDHVPGNFFPSLVTFSFHCFIVVEIPIPDPRPKKS